MSPLQRQRLALSAPRLVHCSFGTGDGSATFTVHVALLTKVPVWLAKLEEISASQDTTASNMPFPITIPLSQSPSSVKSVLMFLYIGACPRLGRIDPDGLVISIGLPTSIRLLHKSNSRNATWDPIHPSTGKRVQARSDVNGSREFITPIRGILETMKHSSIPWRRRR